METESNRVTRRARLGRHVRSNLVGYVALFIAVSMTPLPSYAAGALIGTNGIKNGAVTTPKLAASAVKAPKLAANSVSSAKIQDGKINKVDLAAAARGYTSIVTKRVQGDTDPDGGTSSRTVACDPGQVAIGGGAYVNPGGLILGNSGAGILQLSLPNVVTDFPFQGSTGVAGNGVAPTHWRTVVLNNQGEEVTAFHYAICASK